MSDLDKFMASTLNEQSSAFSEATTADMAMAQEGLMNPDFQFPEQLKVWANFRRELYECCFKDINEGNPILPEHVRNAADAHLSADPYLLMRARQFENRAQRESRGAADDLQAEK